MIDYSIFYVTAQTLELFYAHECFLQSFDMAYRLLQID